VKTTTTESAVQPGTQVRSTLYRETPAAQTASTERIVRSIQDRPIMNLKQFALVGLLVLLGSLLGGALASRYFSQVSALDSRVASAENRVIMVDNRATAMDRRLSDAQTSLNQIVLKASDLQGKVNGVYLKATDLNKRLTDIQVMESEILSRLTNLQTNISDVERRTAAAGSSTTTTIVTPNQP